MSLNTVVRDFPSLRQIVVNFDQGRLAILYLLLRRFYRPVPRWGLVAGVVGFEIVLGITGFFAGFREPIVLAGSRNAGSLRSPQRAALGGRQACVGATASDSVWCGWASAATTGGSTCEVDNFKTDRRRAHLADRRPDLSISFESDTDRLMVTARQLGRPDVDDLLSGAGGVACAGQCCRTPTARSSRRALQHITMPRVFFPDKAELLSDSEMVRKYSGVMVAGSGDRHQHRVRLRRRVVHRLRSSLDVPAGLRLRHF